MQVESELFSALLDLGISNQKAGRVAEALSNCLDQRYQAHAAVLATKGDAAALRTEIEVLRGELRTDIAALRADFAALRTDFAELRTETRTDIAALRTDIEALRADMFKALANQTWKLAGLTLAAMGFVAALLKLRA